MFSLKNVKKPLFLLCFRSQMLKTIGFTMFSLKNVKKPLVLLCFRSTMLKNHWFYYVFAQKWWTNIGFTLCSLKNWKKCFSREKFSPCQKQEQNFDTSGKTNAKPIGPRIRGLHFQYSPEWLMRNPYSYKLLRETNETKTTKPSKAKKPILLWAPWSLVVLRGNFGCKLAFSGSFFG